MKRPLAAIGLIYLATSAAAVCLFPGVNFILCITAAVTAIAACFVYREKLRDILVVMSPICIALLVIGSCQLQANALTDSLSEQSCVISGEICEIPRRQYGRWRYVIETDRVNLPEVSQKIRILMTSRNAIEEAKEGDRITCEVQFLQSSDETGYNSTTSLRADGIKARCWCKPYTEHRVTEGGFRLRYVPLRIRRAVISCIRKALPERASAMLCGMLLGDTEYMDSRTVENFRATGIAHLLAVSGLHLTLLTFALGTLLRRLSISPGVSAVLVICFILSFMAVTGFPPSVVRAGVMHILVRLSMLLRRDVDSPTSLSAAILLMCIVNPWSAADIGLQLSVCSTLGLILLSRRLYKALSNGTRRLLVRVGKLSAEQSEERLGRITRYILGSFSATLSAGIAILPLTAIHFGSVSLIAPLTNLLCVYIASVFIIVGIAASLIFCLPLVGWLVSLPLRFVAAALCAYLELVSGGLAGLPLSAVNTSYSYMPYLFFFAALLIGCAFMMNRRMKNELFGRRLRGFVLCEISVLLLAAMLSHRIFCTGAEIIILDANDGGICVCAKNRTHAVLSEAGGDSYGLSVMRETLRAKGVVKVDAVAVSDDSKARSGNIYRILDQYSPDYLLTDTDFHARTKVVIQPFEGGVNLDSPALSLATFTDCKGGKWQRLTCGEAVAIICPEKGNCALLPESWRSCDAAVVGKDITGMAALSVGAVIVTAKEKNAEALCRRLRDMGLQHVYSTSVNGSVTLSVKDGRLRIQTKES